MALVRLLICPVHLRECEGTDCDMDQCENTGKPGLVACERCGDLHEPWCDPPVCLRCDCQSE